MFTIDEFIVVFWIQHKQNYKTKTMGYMYLMRSQQLMMSLMSLMSFVYLLPLIQALIAYEKTRWLERQFASSVSSGDAENKMRAKLLEASKPGQSFPIYKLVKFYLASIGIAGLLMGLLMMVIPAEVWSDRDAFNALLFIPLVIGVALFILYNSFFKGHGLWREIAAVFLYIGFVSTAIMAYVNFEMMEWFRSDIFSFVLLGAGLFIIYLTKSSFVSFLYMITVIIASHTVGMFIGYDWMMFIPLLLWVFGVAILYFWIPQLRAAKDIGPKEIIFGIVFMFMILTLTMVQTHADLIIPALAIVLPGLYIFSKAYYQKATIIIAKPIELFVIIIVISMAAWMSTNFGMTQTGESISLFENYSFHKQFAYFILIGLIAGVFYISNDLGDASEDINPMIAFFPLGAFFIAYIMGEYGGHYIMTLFLLGAGFLYVRKGIDKKDALRVGLGATVFISTFIIKILDILHEIIDSQFMGGLFAFFFGAFIIGVVVYIRSQWTVSNPQLETSSGNDLQEEVIDMTTPSAE